MRAPRPPASRLHRIRKTAAALALAVLAAAPQPTRAATAPAEPKALLQLGLYQKDGEAWWAWESLRRASPNLADGLSPKVVPLDAKRQGSGVALRATAPAGLDVQALCRRMVGAGFGCLVLDAPPNPAPPPAPAPTPASQAGTDGAFTYGPDDARTMADIERHGRRKGRLGAVIPDTTWDVTPAVLKRENWNLCALTFDDGPHRVVTRQILDVLNREKIRATYFPIGKVAESQGEVIRDFIAAGHEIGNHSLTHSDLRALTPEAQRFEIAEANRILRGFGADPVLFRPPYGRYTLDLLSIARDERMSPVLWTVDTRDWQVRDPDKIVQHVKTEAGTGSVLLLHSTYPSTLTALPRVIGEMRAKGCEFVTLSEWIERMRLLASDPVVSASATSGATRN
ncbi:polysaccharide deacetylase family protein [Azospirillum rugosum]|uniref:Chitooligosaccharide deacetylase n=1 Tax=Azospirillum rugosum TaxID=416170 RepID=A0ABS4SQP5_9PROT|nr:polysaccharide deacetylase family protein [Azospirillum rugosum]MBP2294875.1 peptidoglycan/xylan/chitin deacetylase (PgdA/CDA1 family) [Azospirillum rugosum]MDQ0528203.1 peptidoglycan/xylan/chitin deacetylase (PgdA/CDA1 family) [Azospirillum rugosum]